MDDVEQRLIRCFQVIFPELSEREIRQASTESVDAWDSIATVTLINVVEEEFGIQVEVENLEDFFSFARWRQYLRDVVS